MWNFLKLFIDSLSEPKFREIMIVKYDLTLNKVECIDWYGYVINSFTGVFDDKMFDLIKQYSRLGEFPNSSFPNTRIYIWAGMERKHLAYNEPIRNYINDIGLWKTGQGFHFGSGKRYGVKQSLICPCCGRRK